MLFSNTFPGPLAQAGIDRAFGPAITRTVGWDSSAKELIESASQPATVRAVNTMPFSIRFAVAWIAVAVSLGLSPSARASEPMPAVGLKLVAEGFVSPLNFVTLPDGSGRQLIADQVGTIHV